MKTSNQVQTRVTQIVLPTYLPAAPDKNPMFLEKRVYQGSSGKVYPLPFTDRIAEKPVDRKWRALWIENEFLRVLVLPEIGGRIHRILDKTNNYDLIYYQPVIKPALVGLAGSWVSGGIEFNWPQHHRPATFLPVDFEIEKHADGSATIWCSDHDPMSRMKGMHGVRLHPGRAYVELKARAYNRTPFVQTFLWWANVATRVHEAYQSFFPPDVTYVADHARRSMSEYPLAKGFYYGVNYGERGRKGIPAGEVPGQFVPTHCDQIQVGRVAPRAPSSEFSDSGAHGVTRPTYAPNDLSFYANIPVPTSYMCMGSREDFFGGYDYKAQAGIVHIANHHISPGKKQWTWGNHEFGYAWDRNLTDKDAHGEYGPYIEIMAGVYTDNQPDFSFLQPGETKAWSQYWYPIQQIGPAQHANLDVAVSLRVLDCGSPLPPSKSAGGPAHSKTLRTFARLGVSVTAQFPRASIVVTARNKPLFAARRDLTPGKPFVTEIKLTRGVAETDLLIRVTDRDGNEIISYQPKLQAKAEVPPPATEPLAPADIASADELFTTGLHLEQYRHATRCPALYWHEALRRDPLDSRCNNALGRWHVKRGEFADAEKHFRRAIARLTQRNANPYDGEAYYNLGLTLRYQADALPTVGAPASPPDFGQRVPKAGEDAGAPAQGQRARLLNEAYDAFYKACWNQAWMAAGYHALAEIDCCREDWARALEHLNRSLRFDIDNLRARNLKVVVLRKLGRDAEAKVVLRETLRLDPLDWWARQLSGKRLACDAQTALDIAHNYARAGFFSEAVLVLCDSVANGAKQLLAEKSPQQPLPTQSSGSDPIVQYTLGWLLERSGDMPAARRSFRMASVLPSDYCFPARLEEIAILEAAMRANPRDAKAPYYLGNLFYDRRRHDEAIRLWEKSARLDGNFSIAWRNLGIGYFNICNNVRMARAAYDCAFRANPSDARLLYERDQLWKRLGEKPAKRLRELEEHLDLVKQRDDLSVELCALYNQTGQSEKALALVSSRKFQPWEGGEGGPLGQWVRAHLALGRRALGKAESGRRKGENKWILLTSAATHFEAALTAPENLGEAKHMLANQSDIHYWLGCVLDAMGKAKEARAHWRVAATFKGDFQEMSVRAFSEMTYFSAMSWAKLGQRVKAQKLFRDLLACALKLQKSDAKIDYFATSLPTMLLFDDDLQFRQETTALFLQAQARLGLGQKSKTRKLLALVLKRNPAHALASDLCAITH